MTHADVPKPRVSRGNADRTAVGAERLGARGTGAAFPADPGTEPAGAVVLAGGAGPPGATTRLGGISLLERTTRVLRAAGIDRIVVITDEPATVRLAQRLPVEVVDADALSLGAVADQAHGRLLVVPDQLVFDVETVRALVDTPGAAVLAGRTGLAIVEPAWLDTVVDHGPGGLAGAVYTEPAGLAAPVRTAAEVPRVERLLWQRYGPKRTDGLVARYLNRPLSRPVTMLLVHRPRLTPSMLTLASFGLTVLGAGVVAVGSRWWLIAGALLIQIGNALDGVDGEIARLSMRVSRRGGLLDTTLDRYADIAVIAGLVLAAGSTGWPWGFAAIAATLLIPYINALSPGAPQRLLRRDVRLLLCAVAAAVDRPLWALVAVAIVGNLDAIRVMCVVIGRAPGPR